MGQTGNYYVVAASGNLTQQSNTVTVGIAPTITGQPVSQTVVAFSVVRFKVTVVTTGSTTYQWYFEGTKAKKFTAVKVGPWIKAVSYTHLDVYKRQVESISWGGVGAGVEVVCGHSGAVVVNRAGVL